MHRCCMTINYWVYLLRKRKQTPASWHVLPERSWQIAFGIFPQSFLIVSFTLLIEFISMMKYFCHSMCIYYKCCTRWRGEGEGSLSHWPTLIILPIVSWRIWNIVHRKCARSRSWIHNHYYNTCCWWPVLANLYATMQWTFKLAPVQLWQVDLGNQPSTCSLRQGCEFESNCSQNFINV
mgnify:CR=1 FL=1